eukprot:836624-Prorocentrum_minimum.AAC.1
MLRTFNPQFGSDWDRDFAGGPAGDGARAPHRADKAGAHLPAGHHRQRGIYPPFPQPIGPCRKHIPAPLARLVRNVGLDQLPPPRSRSLSQVYSSSSRAIGSAPGVFCRHLARLVLVA